MQSQICILAWMKWGQIISKIRYGGWTASGIGERAKNMPNSTLKNTSRKVIEVLYGLGSYALMMCDGNHGIVFEALLSLKLYSTRLLLACAKKFKENGGTKN